MATKKAPRKTHTKVSRKKLASPIAPKPEPSQATESVIGVHATNEAIAGKYCNVAVIKHTAREFIMDFIFSVDGHSQLSSRVITSPTHAKEIYEAIRNNIEKYEKMFGRITSSKEKQAERSTH